MLTVVGLCSAATACLQLGLPERDCPKLASHFHKSAGLTACLSEKTKSGFAVFG